MDLNKDDIPTNQEIVDSLTKDLEDKLTPLEDSGECSETDDQKVEPDDFIDEEELKSKELDYTEEDIKKLKLEAEELKIAGNSQFKNEEFIESVKTYTLALRTCPFSLSKERSILYSNRAAAKLKLNLTESATEDCTKAIELDPNYVKAYLRRAHLYEKSDKLDECLQDYNKILELDPGNKEASAAAMRLPPLINERNEKLKTEMMGKLKDLGNVILKPFGLSTNNFQMVQDPNSGGYSINFKQ